MKNNYKININCIKMRKFNKILDIILFLITFYISMKMPDKYEYLHYMGIGIIVISSIITFKVRKNRNLLFLFMIISFINISLSNVDLINKGLNVAQWQIPLRITEYNMYTAKSIFLFMSTLNIFIPQYKEINIGMFTIERKKNLIISYVGVFALFAILIIGYENSMRHSIKYVSNTNPLYEYSIIIYLVVWFFSKDLKFSEFLLKFYCAIYIIQSFLYGDRSAAFLMIILFALLNIEKISIRRLMILAIIAVFFSNFIAVNRDYKYLETGEKVSRMIERGLYSDTVSYAYYSSITITALNDYCDVGENVIFFSEFIKSIFIGTGNVDIQSLTVYTRNSYKELFNRGGGIYSAYFFAYFRYIGVIFSAIILGIILRYIYNKYSSIAKLYQVLIVTFSIRWYLYNPITLYRSILVIFTLLLFISSKVDKILNTINERYSLRNN